MAERSAEAAGGGRERAEGELPLRVVERWRESEHVVSLLLEPVEGAQWVSFRAGQHLPIRLDLPGRPVATYTLSSSPRDVGRYRISVKREPNGLGGSRFLHEEAQVGAVLRARRPRGSFHLPDDVRSVVLLTGGIGVTPALSMLAELVHRPDVPVHFVHAVRNRREHSFLDEVRALATGTPNVSVFVAYDEMVEGDLAEGRCHHVGPLDRAVLRSILPQDRHTVFLCGPDGFMRAMRAALTDLGVPDGSIHQESFGSAVPAALPSTAKADARDDAPAGATGTQVVFRRSGKTALWQGSGTSLLDLAEESGLRPEFSCRAGVCGTCACRLVEGTVAYDEEPLDPPLEGEVLICCAHPTGPVTLDL